MERSIITLLVSEQEVAQAVCLNCEPTGTLDTERAAAQSHVEDNPGHVVLLTRETVELLTVGQVLLTDGPLPSDTTCPGGC